MDQQQLTLRDRRSGDRDWFFSSDALGKQKVHNAAQGDARRERGATQSST